MPWFQSGLGSRNLSSVHGSWETGRHIICCDMLCWLVEAYVNGLV